MTFTVATNSDPGAAKEPTSLPVNSISRCPTRAEAGNVNTTS